MWKSFSENIFKNAVISRITIEFFPLAKSERLSNSINPHETKKKNTKVGKSNVLGSEQAVFRCLEYSSCGILFPFRRQRSIYRSGTPMAAPKTHISTPCMHDSQNQGEGRQAASIGEKEPWKLGVWVDLHRCREGICTLLAAEKRKTIWCLTQRTRVVSVRSVEKIDQRQEAYADQPQIYADAWDVVRCLLARVPTRLCEGADEYFGNSFANEWL